MENYKNKYWYPNTFFSLQNLNTQDKLKNKINNLIKCLISLPTLNIDVGTFYTIVTNSNQK